MINGEGTPEYDSGPTSPDLFGSFPTQKSCDGDASPASLSHYSSCGESEFERYCSANSVMGTPSLCSSSFGAFNDSIESDFGSTRSLDGSWENFRLNRSLEERKLSTSGIDCLKGSVEGGVLKSETDGAQVCDNEETRGEGSGICSELDVGQESNLIGVEAGNRVVNEGNRGYVSGLGLDLEFDGGEMEGVEEGTSSRYEHSEDDDSMYGCGSDDENRKNLYVHGKVEVTKDEDQNPLLINTSVAFGSNDWDDFEQETGGVTVSALIMDGLQVQKKQDGVVERGISDSTSFVLNGLSVGQTNMAKGVVEEPACIRQIDGDELAENSDGYSMALTGFQNSELEQVEVTDVPLTNCPAQGAHEMDRDDKSTSIFLFDSPSYCKLEQEDIKGTSVVCNQDQDANNTMEHPKSCSVGNIFGMEQDPLLEITPLGLGLDSIDHGVESGRPCVTSEEVNCTDDSKFFKNQESRNLEEVDPLCVPTSQLCSHPTEYANNESVEFFEDFKIISSPSVLGNEVEKTSEHTPASVDLLPLEADNCKLNNFYDEIVNEMEEILLDSGKSSGMRFPQGNCMFQSQLSLPLRDGGSTASTSSTDLLLSLRIDGVEVVGAKQKKGDVSLSERLVGVKEYTVYVIRVWSGNNRWEVERRYRDFYTLYRRLKSLFSDQGWTLPSPWSCVEKESRKIFGNASPDVVSERSVLIQDCLRSILHSGFFSSPPSALVWFLYPQDSLPNSPASKTLVPWSIFPNRGTYTENISALGKTISLIVEIRPYKTTKQLLEAQHYTCAGCHKHFDDGMTLVRDFIQTLGWGKHRLCEYTGQLFCSSCHTNETAVLPARVLHYWDFTRYPVSQLAKSYLDSIYDQPMLCVSAVNPTLFSKVAALHHVMGIRKKIGTMLPYIHCPFRRTINKGLGSRRYLIESNDFFALRDLIDLSKGAFAALPVMLENVSRKILEHITEQCLICCDVGVPCSARQACGDPSSLIFPFQEDDIERCKSCESMFHKPCFKRLANCSCGARLGVDDEAMGLTNRLSRKASGYLLGGRSNSGLSVGLLSGLFSKSEKTKDHRDSSTVILMGSLPSTSL